jgi:hypothetical protein
MDYDNDIPSRFVGASPGSYSNQPPQPPSVAVEPAEEVKEPPKSPSPSFAIDDEPPSPLPQQTDLPAQQEDAEQSLDLDQSLGLEGLEGLDLGDTAAVSKSGADNTTGGAQPIHPIPPPPAASQQITASTSNIVISAPTMELLEDPVPHLTADTLAAADNRRATLDSLLAPPSTATIDEAKKSEDWLLDELEKQLSPTSDSDFSCGVEVNLDNLEIEDSWDDMNDLKEMMAGIESSSSSSGTPKTTVEDI